MLIPIGSRSRKEVPWRSTVCPAAAPGWQFLQLRWIWGLKSILPTALAGTAELLASPLDRAAPAHVLCPPGHVPWLRSTQGWLQQEQQSWLGWQGRTAACAATQELPDKALTQGNSLIQLITALVLLCQVAKAEQEQFNSAGHTATPELLFGIPPLSPVSFVTRFVQASSLSRPLRESAPRAGGNGSKHHY